MIILNAFRQFARNTLAQAIENLDSLLLGFSDYMLPKQIRKDIINGTTSFFFTQCSDPNELYKGNFIRYLIALKGYSDLPGPFYRRITFDRGTIEAYLAKITRTIA